MRTRLDAHQQAFVDEVVDGKGPVVKASAAAGSGKTTTTVEAVRALVEDADVDPEGIVITTFTSKAGKELTVRLARALGKGPARRLRVGTFHSLALRALREADDTDEAGWTVARCLDLNGRAQGVPSASFLWRIITSWGAIPGTAERGLDLGLRALGLRHQDYAGAADVLRAGGLEQGAVGSDDAARRVEREGLRLPRFRRAWALYEEAKRSLNAWDFADSLHSWWRLLATEQGKGEQVTHVFVDEAQDNSRMQLQIAQLLARNGRLFLVGDERQAIYTWRGAAPEVFHRAGEEGVVCRLPRNYRSGKAIVDVGNRVAGGQPWSDGPVEAARGNEGIAKVLDGIASGEHAGVAARIGRDLEGELYKPRDIAILVRTNAAAGLFEAALATLKIPCRIVGGKSFFTLPEVTDEVIPYAALIEHDSVKMLEKIANVPSRFLGAAFLGAVKRESGSLLSRIRAAGRSTNARGAAELASTLEQLRAAGWPVGLDLIPGILLRKGSEPVDVASGDDDRGAIYAAAIAIAKRFPNSRDLIGFMLYCQEQEQEENPNRVSISTVHRAKGLEWPVVYVSATQGEFPHLKSLDDEGRMAEERRLFYVAVTRARDALYGTWSGQGGREGQGGRSEFFAAFPKGEGHIFDEEGQFDTNRAPAAGRRCLVCKGAVWETPSGMVCKLGHGGAEEEDIP